MPKRKPRRKLDKRALEHRVVSKLDPDADGRKARVDELAEIQKRKGKLPKPPDKTIRKWAELFEACGEYGPEAEAAIEKAAGWR